MIPIVRFPKNVISKGLNTIKMILPITHNKS